MARRRRKSKLPETLPGWAEEIDNAFEDAAEAMPFGPMAGTEIAAADLFQLAPHVCIKFRGLRLTDEERERIVEVALANYVVNLEPDVLDDEADAASGPTLKTNPRLAFALCYVAAHLALDLVDEHLSKQILVYYEESFAAR